MRFQSRLLSCAATAALLLPLPALAQSAAPPAAGSVLNEVVVTATRRSTKLQDTPASIAAVGAKTLQQTGATGIADVFRQVPNLNFTPGAIGSTRISIRGVQATGEATTGLYYDETPVTGPAGTTQDPGNNAADLNLFDIQQVEVLRGPQGTLFGSGSMGGTIRVIYNKPDTTKYAGAVEAQDSGTEHGGNGYFVKGMVNIPIVEDHLAFRVSGYDEQRAGYIDNVRTGQNDINSSTSKGFHASLLFKPTQDLTIIGTAVYQTTNSPDQQGWYASVGKYKTNSEVKLPFESTIHLYNLTANWDTPIGMVTATGSHYDYDILRTLDFTASVAAISQSPALCAAYYGAVCTTAQKAAFASYGASRLPAIGYQPARLSMWTGEVRLVGSRGPFHWAAGVYDEDRHDHIDSYVVRADSATGAAIQPLDITSHRYINTPESQTAFFGEFSYNPIERLTLTAGIRHFQYDKSTDGAVITANVLTALFPEAYSKVSTRASGVVDKFTASYRFTSQILGYLTYSEGFRPGGVNNIPGLPTDLVVYKSDHVRNFEGGLKTSWFDHRLTVDASAFLVKWYDLQTPGLTSNGLYSFLTNAGRAEIPGAEIEVSAQPIHGLTLTAGGGLADAHLTQNQSSTLVAPEAQNGLSGDLFPNVPKYTASASATYQWPIKSSLNGLVRADYAFTGQRASAFQPSYVYYEKEGAFSTLNLRAGVNGDGWGLYGFINNVTDSDGVLAAYSTLGVKRQLFTIAPRTIGANFRKDF